MGMEKVPSCPDGPSPHGAISDSCLLPPPPFLMTLPPHVPQACQLQLIPDHTHSVLLSPDLIVLVLSICLNVQVRDLSHLLPYSHSTKMETST